MKATRRTWPAAFAFLALLCFCLSPAQAADTAAPQPKIQFAQLVHDFGKSAPNMDLKHSFTFKNTGKALLIIENVKAG
ncbi:MAG: DUF1573 domain-containing protein [Deltaproteobacteria bacterium]|nr:DUF1573 domain-containing protein [Deltaproteobacteria bacterium]